MSINEEAMTTRERIQATIDGEEVDRFPVWLKMANSTWRTGQPESIQKMGDAELLQAAECDVMVGVDVRTHRKAPHIEERIEEQNGIRITTYETPDGPISGKEFFDTGTSSWHPVEFMASTPENLRRLRWAYKDTEYKVDGDAAVEAAERKRRLVEADAYTMSGCGPTPFMSLVEHLSGPVDTYYLLYDEPELFAEVTDEMHQDRMRMLRTLLPHVQADTFWLTENTSTTLLSPQVFKEWCFPHLKAYGDLILEHGTAVPVHHMCGTLNALLEQIDGLPAQVNEAYTTRPLGDVSLAEGRKRMPSKALWGGTNATLWLEEPEVIVNTVAEDLAECPDRKRIFLTSAGVLPPLVSFEKARKVASGLKKL